MARLRLKVSSSSPLISYHPRFPTDPMPENAVIWEPISGINFPCADISFASRSAAKLRVLMHFSRVANGPKEDLEIEFSGVIGVRWADEFHGSIVSGARPSDPKCAGEHWAQWTFPMLRVRDSDWLAAHLNLPGTESREHFSLISMNDLLDVIALPQVAVRWVPPASDDSPSS